MAIILPVEMSPISTNIQCLLANIKTGPIESRVSDLGQVFQAL